MASEMYKDLTIVFRQGRSGSMFISRFLPPTTFRFILATTFPRKAEKGRPSFTSD